MSKKRGNRQQSYLLYYQRLKQELCRVLKGVPNLPLSTKDIEDLGDYTDVSKGTLNRIFEIDNSNPGYFPSSTTLEKLIDYLNLEVRGWNEFIKWCDKTPLNDNSQKSNSPEERPKPKLHYSPQFTSVITLPNVDFVGREFLVKEIDNFVQHHRNGYYVIDGDPGIGKTAFLSNLVQHRGYPHHLNIRAEGITTPEHFFKMICGQLLGKYFDYEYIKSLSWHPSIQYLKELLETLSQRQKEKIVLVVDALDEANQSNIVGENPLQLPKSLPENIFIVITTRRTAKNLLTAPDTETGKYSLLSSSRENIKDILLFIEKKLYSLSLNPQLKINKQLISTMIENLSMRSEGNFMYLSYIFKEIESGSRSIENISDIPQGLNNYYEDHWQIMRKQNSPEWKLIGAPILAIMAIVKEPISAEMIQSFSGIKKFNDVKGFLRDHEQFFQKNDKDGLTCYRFYHSSFLEFIQKKEEIEDEKTDLVAANKKLNKFWQKKLNLNE